MATRTAAVAVPPGAMDDLDVRLRASELRLAALQGRLDAVIVALDDASARFHAVVALLGELPTSEATTGMSRELRHRLEQLLVAQRRTNELLDLALGVAIEADAPRRQAPLMTASTRLDLVRDSETIGRSQQRSRRLWGLQAGQSRDPPH